MDMNTNRYEKLVQVPSRGAERASCDDATIEQCQSAYRQSTKTTVTEVDTNFAGKPKPTQYQGTAVTAEEAGTDGTTNVQCHSIDCDNMGTTVMKFPTDCVKFTEPTLARVSLVVAKMAHTDGTRAMQYQSDDQNTASVGLSLVRYRCMLSWKSPMRHCYVAVIVDALGILQLGCRGHLFWTRRTGGKIFLLNPKIIASRSPGPRGLTGRWRWTVHR